MTRTLVDIPDEMIKKLDILADEKHVSRAELVRLAVGFLIEENLSHSSKKVFGILKNTSMIDGVKWQRNLREEW